MDEIKKQTKNEKAENILKLNELIDKLNEVEKKINIYENVKEKTTNIKDIIDYEKKIFPIETMLKNKMINTCKTNDNLTNDDDNIYMNLYGFSDSFTSSLKKILDNPKLLNTIFHFLQKMNRFNNFKKYTVCDILHTLNLMSDFCEVYTNSNLEKIVKIMFDVDNMGENIIKKTIKNVIQDNNKIKYFQLTPKNNFDKIETDKLLDKIMLSLNYKGLQYDSVLIYEINRVGKNKHIYKYTNEDVYKLYKEYIVTNDNIEDNILNLTNKLNESEIKYISNLKILNDGLEHYGGSEHYDGLEHSGGMVALSIAIKIIKICIFIYVTFKFIQAIKNIRSFIEDFDKKKVIKETKYIDEIEKLKNELEQLKKQVKI